MIDLFTSTLRPNQEIIVDSNSVFTNLFWFAAHLFDHLAIWMNPWLIMELFGGTAIYDLLAERYCVPKMAARIKNFRENRLETTALTNNRLSTF